MAARGKLRTDWPARLGRCDPWPRTRRDGRLVPRVLIHAVSVGEVNAVRELVADLARDHEVAVSVTTDTGIARARGVFAPPVRVVRYPFDFSGAVRSVLDAVQPDAVALAELELWPNFTQACECRGIPIAIVNGRLSERSFRRSLKVRPLLSPMFHRVAAVGAQTDDYAARFRAMGVAHERVQVVGTMKWDTARIADTVEGADALAAALGIDRSKPLVVAGSTEPLEHALLRDAVPAGVQLLCAPRKPEWFEDAARDLAGCARRSTGACGSATGRFLLDTIGELRMAYALADVVVVGRSFGELHGSDMIEPVALGKATVIGPRWGDFAEPAQALLAAGGLMQAERGQLAAALAGLLNDPAHRARMAQAGRAVIRARQGATARNAAMVRAALTARQGSTTHARG
jgi:3-deoxy-D-manno-octulosonic-acid transferase